MKSTFKEFLLEAQSRTQEISKEKAIELIKVHCLKYFKNAKKTGNYIYRGTDNADNEYTFGDSSKTSRIKLSQVSGDTYHNLLIDNLPSWKEFPKREKSFINSTSSSHALGFGDFDLNYYYVFPYDGLNVGIVPGEDINMIDYDYLENKTGVDNFSRFNDSINNMFLLISHDIRNRSWNDFKKGVEDINEFIKNTPKDEYLEKLIRMGLPQRNERFAKSILKYNSFEEFINDVFDPEKNGFKLIKSNNLPTISNLGNNEVWFSGPSVFIRADVVDEFIEEI